MLTATRARTRLVALRLSYDAGTRDSAAHPGVAELTFRSMLDATAHVPAGGYRESLGRLGATYSSDYVGRDSATVKVIVPPEAVETILWSWSDQMAFARAAMTPQTLAHGRALIANDRRAQIDDVPFGSVDGFVRDAIYPPHHPYRAATQGEIDALTVADVTEFYDHHYNPNQAVLTIVGDIDESKAMSLARRYFEAIPAAPPTTHEAKPVALAGEIRLNAVAGVDNAAVVVAWPTPPQFQKDDVELDVLARVLQGGMSSYLGWALISEKAIAVHVSAHQASNDLGSIFTIRVEGRPGISPKTLLEAVDDELGRLDEKALGRWVKQADAELMVANLMKVEQSSGRADAFTHYAQFAKDPGYVSKLARRISKVGPSDVAETMARQLRRDRRVVVQVTPRAGAPLAGQLLDMESK